MLKNIVLLIFTFSYLTQVVCQPGMDGGMGGMDGGGGGGYTAATGCEGVQNDEECSTDGSSNYNFWNMTYDSTNGIFTGSIKTNLCSNHEYQSAVPHRASCSIWYFPTFEGPIGAPLLGALGVNRAGIDINNAFEAGFQSACNGDITGTCDGGVDVATCVLKLRTQCGAEFVNYGLFEDSCGGHASPYHHHTDLLCDYDSGDIKNHSAFIGIAFDGRGIYGRNEGDQQLPVLDACQGHFGPVPGFTNDQGEYFEGADNVYHYHTTSELPFLLNCYGPAETISDCMDLFPEVCGDGTINMCTEYGEINYDIYCPCFKDTNGTLYNQEFISTENCPTMNTIESENETTENETTGEITGETTGGTTDETTENETTDETTDAVTSDVVTSVQSVFEDNSGSGVNFNGMFLVLLWFIFVNK